MTDKDSKRNRLNAFIGCFNIAYPDWEINGDASKDLKPTNVEYRTLTSYIGKCGPRNNGRVYFGLNHSWWERNDTEAHLGLLIHELAHVKHTNHRPEFWEHVVRLYDRLTARPHMTATALNVDRINWDDVKEWLVRDPTTSTVDNRIENAYERRIKLANALGYPAEQVEPFDGITAYWVRHQERSYRTVTSEDLHYESHTLTELREWFKNPRKRTGMKIDRGRFHVEFPVVVESNGNLEVIDGHYRVDLQKYVRNSSGVVVEVMEGSEPQS